MAIQADVRCIQVVSTAGTEASRFVPVQMLSPYAIASTFTG